MRMLLTPAMPECRVRFALLRVSVLATPLNILSPCLSQLRAAWVCNGFSSASRFPFRGSLLRHVVVALMSDDRHFRIERRGIHSVAHFLQGRTRWSSYCCAPPESFLFSMIRLPSAYVDPLDNSPRSDSSDECRGCGDLPFDLDEQKSCVATERWRHHIQWCDRMYESQRMSHHNRRISLKILVSEAFHREVEDAKRRGELDASTRLRLKSRWQGIAHAIMNEMEHQDNSALVLRTLSSMCLFDSTSHGREYGENVEAHRRRLGQMQEMLQRMKSSGSLFDTAGVHGSEPQLE